MYTMKDYENFIEKITIKIYFLESALGKQPDRMFFGLKQQKIMSEWCFYDKDNSIIGHSFNGIPVTILSEKEDYISFAYEGTDIK